MLLFVYFYISSAEKAQSDHIENQVEIMQDQLRTAHSPQIAIDDASFDRAGATFRLTNVGNGPATGIEFYPSIEARDASEIEIEVYWTDYRWQHSEEDYLEAGDGREFTFLPEVVIYKHGQEEFRGQIGEAAEVLQDEEVKSLRWDTEISFNTILSDDKETILTEHAVLPSALVESSKFSALLKPFAGDRFWWSC